MPRRPAPASPPADYDGSQFPVFAVTVDVVILTITGGQLMVLLVKRGGAPYESFWALPGGFKRVDETLEDAARRELHEETGLPEFQTPHLRQLGAYGNPGRDERGNVVTVVFTAVVPDINSLRAGSDAKDAALWPVDAILDGDLKLAFDHAVILKDAAADASRDLETTDLATAFVVEPFTLSQLRTVFEAVWRTKIDAPNFRRSLFPGDGDWVEPTGKQAATGGAGGRPAELFRATDQWRNGAPIRHPSRAKRSPTQPRRPAHESSESTPNTRSPDSTSN